MALSTTLTSNNLEYIRKSLNLRAPVRLCKRPLDRPNITYSVAPIKKKGGFSDLDFLVPAVSGKGEIKKTMIFVDSIGQEIAMAKYLRSLLPDSLKSEGKMIIQSFSSDLEPETKTR